VRNPKGTALTSVPPELRHKPPDRTYAPKTVVFVTTITAIGSFEKSDATNPWQICLWFCHVLGRCRDRTDIQV